MDADVGEVGAEAGFHLLADRGVQGPAGFVQDVVDGGALHGGLGGLGEVLVTAARAVLVLFLLRHGRLGVGVGVAGELQHAQDRCVARGALQCEESGLVRWGRLAGRWGLRAGRLVGVVLLLRQLTAFQGSGQGHKTRPPPPPPDASGQTSGHRCRPTGHRGSRREIEEGSKRERRETGR